jgi:hypothetical protein
MDRVKSSRQPYSGGDRNDHRRTLMQTLKPMTWPRPVPLLLWGGDYADIRERIRRDGRLERDEVWTPDSDDSWNHFRTRHGDWNFDLDWKELERRALEGPQQRVRNEAYRQQTAWEVERQRRQLAKQAEADREWQAAETVARVSTFFDAVAQARDQQAREQQAIADALAQEAQATEDARRYWATIDAAYAAQSFHFVSVTRSAIVAGVGFEQGNNYWVPYGVMILLEAPVRRRG